jgi:hypothetical protein
MTQKTETAEELTHSMQEVSQAVTKSITEAQQRSMKYAQSIFENGVEVLKENTQEGRKLMQSLMEQPQEPQHAFQSWMNSAVAIQERNIKYAQGVIENGAEVLKSQAESNRALVQTLVELLRKQQEAFQGFAQEPMKGYLEFFSAPLSFYQKAVESAQEVALQGVHTAQRVAQQGAEANHKAAHTAAKASAAAAK